MLSSSALATDIKMLLQNKIIQLILEFYMKLLYKKNEICRNSAVYSTIFNNNYALLFVQLLFTAPVVICVRKNTAILFNYTTNCEFFSMHQFLLYPLRSHSNFRAIFSLLNTWIISASFAFCVYPLWLGVLNYFNIFFFLIDYPGGVS